VHSSTVVFLIFWLFIGPGVGPEWQSTTLPSTYETFLGLNSCNTASRTRHLSTLSPLTTLHRPAASSYTSMLSLSVPAKTRDSRR
jgi:hypothetical protein